MSKECKYLVVILKSGAFINLFCGDEISAREKLGVFARELGTARLGGLLIGAPPGPTMFLIDSELAAMYISAEPRR